MLSGWELDGDSSVTCGEVFAMNGDVFEEDVSDLEIDYHRVCTPTPKRLMLNPPTTPDAAVSVAGYEGAAWALLLLLAAAAAGTTVYRRNRRGGDGVAAVAVSDFAPPTAAPDWYPDPTGRYGHRYWDGARWTEQVATDGVQYEDPFD